MYEFLKKSVGKIQEKFRNKTLTEEEYWQVIDALDNANEVDAINPNQYNELYNVIIDYYPILLHFPKAKVSGANASSSTWRRARGGSGPRQKFAMSRSRSAESLSSDTSSKAAKEDVLAKLAKWQAEDTAKKSAEDKQRARKQAEKALLDFQYCVGNVCYQAVGDFCAAHKLSPAEGTELMKFIRYAKEKGLVTPETAQAVSKRDVNTLCKVWAGKRL